MTVTVKRLAFVGALDGEARGKVACLFFFFIAAKDRHLSIKSCAC